MDKEAYTHHVIKAKLFSPSAIRCELIGKKPFTQIVNIVNRSAQSKNSTSYRNTNNLKIQKQYRLRWRAPLRRLWLPPQGVPRWVDSLHPKARWGHRAAVLGGAPVACARDGCWFRRPPWAQAAGKKEARTEAAKKIFVCLISFWFLLSLRVENFFYLFCSKCSVWSGYILTKIRVIFAEYSQPAECKLEWFLHNIWCTWNYLYLYFYWC